MADCCITLLGDRGGRVETSDFVGLALTAIPNRPNLLPIATGAGGGPLVSAVERTKERSGPRGLTGR